MSHTNLSNGTSQAAIFARLWETESGKIPRELARRILKLGFSQRDKDRMHELAVKNQESQISQTELEELDNFIMVGDLLALLQAKARKALKHAKTRSTHHA